MFMANMYPDHNVNPNSLAPEPARFPACSPMPLKDGKGSVPCTLYFVCLTSMKFFSRVSM